MAKNLIVFLFAVIFSAYSTAQFTQPITVETNDDAVLTFRNTDDSWQYLQFIRNESRKVWMGLSNGNDFRINKEEGGNIIFTGGNIGIGTTLPTSPLHIQSSLNKTLLLDFIGVSSGGSYTWGSLNTNSQEQWRIVGRNNDNAGLEFWNKNSSKVFTLLQNGNVGVGTNNPSKKLEINGDVNIGIDVSDINTGNSTYGNRLYFLGAHDNSDDLWIARYNVTNSPNSSEMRLNIGDDPGHHGDKFVVGVNSGGWNPRFTVQGDGNVGIGTTSPDAKLAVNGTIHTKEVKVDLNGWSDFVFEKDYKLPTLEEVENHINEKGHLPEIPSEAEVMENGINLGEMNAKLLQKIEELTMYLIEQNKQLQEANQNIEELQKMVNASKKD